MHTAYKRFAKIRETLRVSFSPRLSSRVRALSSDAREITRLFRSFEFLFYFFPFFLTLIEKEEEERRVAYTMVSQAGLENQSKSRLTVCVES